MRSPSDLIRPADFPELFRLVWNNDGMSPISGKDALAIDERNWRHVDRTLLTHEETALIAALVEAYGNGVLLADM